MAITFDNNINLGFMIFYNSVANTYTVNNLTTGDYFSDTATVGDILYFGTAFKSVWHDLTLTVGTPLSATSITLAWEFWNGTTWTALTVTDGTSNFTTSGTVAFDVPDTWEHYYRINGTTTGQSGYFIRARITAVSGLTEGGKNITTPIYGKDWTIKLDGGASYLIEDIQTANDSGAWGVVTTTNKYTNITSSLWVTDTDTTFTVRGWTFLEIGSATKTRRFITDDGTTLQIGYKNPTTGANSEPSMVRLWNSPLTGAGNATYNKLAGTTKIYSSIKSNRVGGYNDSGYFGAIDFQEAQLATEGATSGNHYIGGVCTGSIRNTTYLTNALIYIYSSDVAIDNLIFGNATHILVGANGGLISNTYFPTGKNFRLGNSNVTGTARNCTFQTGLPTQINANGSTNTVRVEYSLDLDIRNVSNNLISSPNVKLVNGQGETVFNDVWAGTLNVLIYKQVSTTNTDYNPMTLTISKSGYETYQSTFALTKKTDEIITLKPALDTMLVLGKGIAIKADPTNNTQDRDLLIMN